MGCAKEPLMCKRTVWGEKWEKKYLYYFPNSKFFDCFLISCFFIFSDCLVTFLDVYIRNPIQSFYLRNWQPNIISSNCALSVTHSLSLSLFINPRSRGPNTSQTPIRSHPLSQTPATPLPVSLRSELRRISLPPDLSPPPLSLSLPISMSLPSPVSNSGVEAVARFVYSGQFLTIFHVHSSRLDSSWDRWGIKEVHNFAIFQPILYHHWSIESYNWCQIVTIHCHFHTNWSCF